jgi:hypothetical protein
MTRPEFEPMSMTAMGSLRDDPRRSGIAQLGKVGSRPDHEPRGHNLAQPSDVSSIISLARASARTRVFCTGHDSFDTQRSTENESSQFDSPCRLMKVV